MNVFEALIKMQTNLSVKSTQYIMIQTLLDHFMELKSATIYDMADLCYTSTTSIGRLYKQLGYSSFSEFKQAVNDVIDGYGFLNNPLCADLSAQIDELISLHNDTIKKHLSVVENISHETYEQIAELLHQHKEIIFLMPYPDPESVIGLQENLILTQKKCHVYSDHPQEDVYKQMGKNTLVIFPVMDMHTNPSLLASFKKTLNTQAHTLVLISKKRTEWIMADNTIYLESSGTRLDRHLFAFFFEIVSSLYRHKYL